MTEPKEPPTEYPPENKKPWPPGVTTGDGFDLQAERELVEKATTKPEGEEAELDLHGDHVTLHGKDFELPRATEESLRKFIQDYLAGAIFTSADLREHDQRPESMTLGTVFMPLLLGVFSDYRPEGLRDIGVVYEYWSQALPRSINGYPIFASCRFLHRLDWARAAKVIDRELKRQKEMEIPPDEPEPAP